MGMTTQALAPIVTPRSSPAGAKEANTPFLAAAAIAGEGARVRGNDEHVVTSTHWPLELPRRRQPAHAARRADEQEEDNPTPPDLSLPASFPFFCSS